MAPSDPLYTNAGKNGSIGTATIAAATDEFTITVHGLADGETVTVDTLTGGAVGVLVVNAVYFVRDATLNTFRVSLTLAGPFVAFASDGGAAVFRFAPQYSAAELRRAEAGLMFGGTADAFGARSGVRPGHTPVSLAGTTWTVEDLTGAVYPALTTQSGPYRVAHTEESGALDPADATNPRIDALDLQIQDDDEDASGFRHAHVVYVVGTPGATPVAPAVTATSLRLATILVPATGTPVPSLTIVAPFTVAAGGVLPVRDDTEHPTAGRYHGMVFYNQATDTLEVWDGSAVAALAQTRQPFRGYGVDFDGASTTSEAYTGLAITVPSADNPAGARFKITANAHLDSDVDGDSADIRLRRGTSVGSPLLKSNRRQRLGPGGDSVSLTVVDDPPSGSAIYGLFVARTSGTGTIQLSASSTYEPVMAVEEFDQAGT